MSGDELGGAVRAAAEAEAEERCLQWGSGVLGVVLLITDYREQRLDQIGRWWLVEEMADMYPFHSSFLVGLTGPVSLQPRCPWWAWWVTAES